MDMRLVDDRSENERMSTEGKQSEAGNDEKKRHHERKERTLNMLGV